MSQAMFAGKSVLVTGGASGIGRAAARRFAQEGARLCVADLDGPGAAATVRLITEAGGEAFGCRVDIARREDNARMVDETLDRFGGLDVAFLNAGYLGPMDGFEGTDEDLFDRHLAINLKGGFYGLKAVHRAIRPGGAVVVTASTAGLVGLAESPGYTAAKHGLIGLVRAAAPAFAARNARINAICPGRVATPMMGQADSDDLSPPEQLQRPRYRAPGTAQQVAEFALYLASPAAAFITGGAHICDAGLLATFAVGPELD